MLLLSDGKVTWQDQVFTQGGHISINGKVIEDELAHDDWLDFSTAIIVSSNVALHSLYCLHHMQHLFINFCRHLGSRVSDIGFPGELSGHINHYHDHDHFSRGAIFWIWDRSITFAVKSGLSYHCITRGF